MLHEMIASPCYVVRFFTGLGLQFMRNRGVIHGDLRSYSIFVKKNDGCPFLKIDETMIPDNDVFMETMFLESVVPQTLSFKAPESMDAFFDHKVDVWSAGVILYCIATGNNHLVLPSSKLTLALDPSFQAQFAVSKLDFSRARWNVSELMETLECMFVINPDDRADWERVLETKWLTHGAKVTEFKINGTSPAVFASLPVLGIDHEGVVFPGNLGGKLDKKMPPISVKRIRKAFLNYGRACLKQEYAVLRELQDLNHPYIVKFFGLIALPSTNRFDDRAFVYEYCPTSLASRIWRGLSECEAHMFFKQIGLLILLKHFDPFL